MTTLWQMLADRINVLLGNKLRIPLTGADMVQVITAWKEIKKEEASQSQK